MVFSALIFEKKKLFLQIYFQVTEPYHCVCALKNIPHTWVVFYEEISKNDLSLVGRGLGGPP